MLHKIFKGKETESAQHMGREGEGIDTRAASQPWVSVSQEGTTAAWVLTENTTLAKKKLGFSLKLSLSRILQPAESYDQYH